MFKLYGIGHRFLQDEEKIRKQISESIDYFIATYGELNCISSLAQGADTIFIQEAIKKNCQITIVLPFQKEIFEEDFDKTSIKTLHSILAKHPHRVKSIISDSKEKEQAFLETGLELTKESDAILAVWDGLNGQGIGGTKDQIDYAIEIGKEIHWIKARRLDQTTIDSVNIDENISSDFTKEDKLAILNKKRYHRVWTTGIFFGLAAIFFMEINFGFVQKPSLHLLFTLCGFIALFIAFRMLTIKANQLKNKFVRHRRNAEMLRAEIWKKQIDFNEVPQAFKENKEKSAQIFLKNKKRELWMYLQDQIRYQERRRIKRFNNYISKVSNALLGLRIAFLLSFLLLTVFYFLDLFFTNDYPNLAYIQDISGFLWMAVPPIYASLEGVLHFNEWKKNLKSSLQLVKNYIDLQNQIANSKNLSELESVELQIFETFTFETKDWITEQQNKKIELKI